MTSSNIRPVRHGRRSYLLPENTMLHQRYKIISLIGQGGFGITYNGVDTVLGARIAIKEYYPQRIADRNTAYSKDVHVISAQHQLSYDKGLDRYLLEARNLAKFAGEESIVHVNDFFRENHTAYIIMEYVDGVNISQYLQYNGPMTFDECMKYMRPLMRTLEKIHARGLIHRDISPSNIMILRDGRVKLLDFGAARELSRTTQTLSIIVRPDYAPIEQYSSHRRQGPYTDVYALCATIYTMLTGKAPAGPFSRLYSNAEIVPPTDMGAAISGEQEAVLFKGLAIQPEDRIQSMKDLREQFDSARSNEQLQLLSSPSGTGSAQIAAGGRGRSKFAYISLMAADVLLIFGIIWLMMINL